MSLFILNCREYQDHNLSLKSFVPSIKKPPEGCILNQDITHWSERPSTWHYMFSISLFICEDAPLVSEGFPSQRTNNGDLCLFSLLLVWTGCLINIWFAVYLMRRVVHGIWKTDFGDWVPAKTNQDMLIDVILREYDVYLLVWIFIFFFY